MAFIKKFTDKNERVYYKVQVSAGRGRKVTRTWRPNDGWSAKTIQRELNKFAAELENDLRDGVIVPRYEQIEKERVAELEAAKIKTLRQYADGVFMPAKEITFSENARSNYRQFLDKHILPVLGEQQITDIDAAMITKFIIDFQKKGYAHSTAIKLYNILNGIFEMAYLSDTIPVNPMGRVKRPASRKSETVSEDNHKAYTAAELAHILSCADQEPLKWRTYIYILIQTGIRRGEACGLQWDDIDFQSGDITIRRNLQYTTGKGVYLESPKNGKSRVVDVDAKTLDLLRRLRQEQNSQTPALYVFTQDNSDQPMFPQTPTRYFKKFGEKYGVEDFHPHKLRHTHASIAITNGADPASVGERLGHSDASVTMRIYTHANQESIKRAGDIFRKAIPDDPSE